MDKNDLTRQSLILGALLHDIGKISQRIGGEYYVKHPQFGGNFISALCDVFGEELTNQVVTLIEKHHDTPTKREEYILHIADKLSAAERTREWRGTLKSNEAALVAITSRIKLKEKSGKEKYYRLRSLQISEDCLIPKDEKKVNEREYENLWDNFVKKVKKIGKYQPSDFNTIYFILREFGTFVPSATPWEEGVLERTVPDISLFDHSKVTCALAACLSKLDDTNLTDKEMDTLIGELRRYREDGFDKILKESKIANKPLFLFVRGDIAGIQKFIYSITKPKAQSKGTAKRLRGRSFYVTLLTEVIADWIMRKMDLPVTNILFCGGGRFDILLPNSEQYKNQLKELKIKIDKWLLNEFYGEMSIQIASVEVKPKDFYEFDKIYCKLEDQLVETKMRKFEDLTIKKEFFRSSEEVEKLCSSCQMIPVKKDLICLQCEKQTEIGHLLPKTEFIIYVYGNSNLVFPEEKVINFKDFDVIVLLANAEDMKSIISTQNFEEIVSYRINPVFEEKEGLDFLLENKGEKPISFGFKFLGNSVPLALKNYQLLSSQEPGKKGDILEFEEIAELSTGAKYLGVLKMDVDYLGLLFGLGIDSPSISRIATLSSNFEIFFGDWLNKICERVTQIWEENLPENDTRKGLVESLFYIVYSGGDDLFIVGPWDQTVELAKEIYKDFREYTCRNPNITLSGGIIFVKPAFPIQRIAQLVGEELESSKHSGRDRITLFGETVEWENSVKSSQSFDELLQFAKYLTTQVEDKEKPLPRGFVYFLRRLEEYFHKRESLMWVPNFFYALAKRVKKQGSAGRFGIKSV